MMRPEAVVIVNVLTWSCLLKEKTGPATIVDCDDDVSSSVLLIWNKLRKEEK